MARELKKYKTAAFTGGRGSGKTLSMSTEGALYLVAGYNVWANYPLRFGLRDHSGKVTYYRAKDISIQDIGNFNTDIRNGIILLDELNLWLSSRRSSALINQLAGGWFQLMRKRKLSVYITCQFFHTLDKLIKEQTDLIIECFDLSFKYPNLKPGQSISQLITSYSGYGTGRPLYKMDNMTEWKQNTRARILHGYPFWNVYDSWTEYDILKALTKYEVKRDVVVIGAEDNGGFRGVRAQEQINEMTQLIRELKGEDARYSSEQMEGQLKEWGIEMTIGPGGDAGRLLKKAGWQYKQERYWQGYILKKPEIEKVET